jgi:hypothetical protein
MIVGRLILTLGVHDDDEDERQESSFGRNLRGCY